MKVITFDRKSDADTILREMLEDCAKGQCEAFAGVHWDKDGTLLMHIAGRPTYEQILWGIEQFKKRLLDDDF